MPTTRTRRSRRIVPVIPEAVVRYLTTGEEESGDFEVLLLAMSGARSELRELWQIVREAIIADWLKIKPCSRPWGWWEFDAPRQGTGTGAYFELLPEPRRRVGGIGTPDFEFLAYAPRFEKGIPVGWVDELDVEYYNGRAKDIHGNIIRAKYKEGHFKGKAIDPEDPPAFESEAAYLQRHGSLIADEIKYLATHPELLRPEVLRHE